MFGNRDENVRAIEEALQVNIALTGEGVSIRGDDVQTELAGRVLHELYGAAGAGHHIAPHDVERAVDILSRSRDSSLTELYGAPVFRSARGQDIVPKTTMQRAYVDAMRRHDIVFSIGPAGTGKTYLAMAMAVAQLMDRKCSRIVLTRPAVEAGEKLGFLPGDLAEKINPYLRPLYDALHEMVRSDKAQAMIEGGTVEVAPLAFMRGRTLNDAFVILDEAQNTTRPQMKMFLTRLGFDSKAVITGDVTQVDLPAGQRSGLSDAQAVLSNVPGIGFVTLDDRDVVRHPLVKRIIREYDRVEHRDSDRSDGDGPDTNSG